MDHIEAFIYESYLNLAGCPVGTSYVIEQVGTDTWFATFFAELPAWPVSMDFRNSTAKKQDASFYGSWFPA